MPAGHKADKKISAYAANKPFLSTLLPLTLSNSLEAQALQSLACAVGLAASLSHTSANVWHARKTGITIHVFRCEPAQTGPFICEGTFVLSG